MKPKPLVKNAGGPKGFFGRLMIGAMNKEHTPLSLWGLDHLPEKEYRVALDIGCGGGVNLLRLSDFCDKVYGVDVSDLSVRESEKRCKKEIRAGKIAVSIGKASSLVFADESIDLATAFETVYFWGDLKIAFAEVFRVLKKGGIFLIVNELTANENQPDKYKKVRQILDLSIYDGKELSDRLSEAGFSATTVYTQGEDWTCVVAEK